MKTLLIIPLCAVALLSSACRTFTPLDPMTMQPSDRCLPHGGPTVIDSGK